MSLHAVANPRSGIASAGGLLDRRKQSSSDEWIEAFCILSLNGSRWPGLREKEKERSPDCLTIRASPWGIPLAAGGILGRLYRPRRSTNPILMTFVPGDINHG